MFQIDGIVYAGEPSPDLKVTQARSTGNHTLLVRFSSGETRLLDGTEFLDIPVFSPLENEETFDSFEIDHGVLTWQDGDIDISPEALYQRTYPYEALPSTEAAS